eukprot:16270194-Heterocapsa_arctica.AAC.1
MAVMPGGAEALRGPVEDPASAIRRTRSSKRAHRARKTAAWWREAAEAGWKAPPWPPPAAQEGAA